MKLFYFHFFIFSIAAFSVYAQSKPILEREVSISFTNEKLDVALAKLARQEKINFSYSPAILNLNAALQISYQKKTLREILINMIGNSVQLKEKGNYIILTKINSQPIKTGSLVPLIISGYVVNLDTDEKIGEVSIYDKKSLTSVITNSYGYFKLTIEKPEALNFISINKRSFRDTVIAVPFNTNSFLTIALVPEQRLLRPMANESDLRKDSSVAEILPPLLSDDDHNQQQQKLPRQLNMENIKDTLYRRWQISLFPFIGTNQTLSGNVINDYSLNIVGGYGLGVKKLELGGYFNMNRGNVGHAQLAGSFNLNMTSMKGFQGAGAFNINLGNAEAVQVAGAFNFNGQASQGAQFAGLMNLQMKDYRGLQMAAFMNFTQVKITGTQIAGFMNYAKYVHGTQIGLINIADSVTGIPLGLINIVKHGYHKIEVSADEIFYTNLAFRTGVPLLHTILTAGIKPDDFEDPYWTVGYGVGTSPKLAKWLYLNFDVTANQVSKGNFTPAINLLNKFYMGFELQPLPKFGITFGATLNAYVTDTTYDGYSDLFTNYKPKIVYDETSSDNINVKMWWGAKVGLRFL